MSQGMRSFPPALRVRHLWQRIGAADVLRDVSFQVAQGEVFGFIGPNGAGKTTTIRVLATLTPPTSGRVEVCGHDVALEPERVRRLVGYMPDHAGIYPNVTVREYLQFYADAYGNGEAGDTRAVDAAMELTELGKLDGKVVSTMSKGMKQRLQLARTLLHDPKILIMDEPASDLDPRARIEMRDLILELARLGKTVFLSSHILTELADVCSSVAILEKGQLLAWGPVGEIAHKLESRTGVEPGARATSTRGLKLRLLAPLQPLAIPLDAALSSTLSELPFVVRAEIQPTASGASVALEYGGGDASIAHVVGLLAARGFGVIGVEPERNELERIFLQVTRGDLQ